MYDVVSRWSGTVGTMSRQLNELVGQHEAIKVYMQTLIKSAEKLAEQTAEARDRLYNYRCSLYDFKDAIWYHLETDEHVFRSIFGDSYEDDPVAEHREIQRLVNEMIAMADNTLVEKMGPEDLNLYCRKIGEAFKKVCRLIELHIAREDNILERVQKALNNNN